MNTMAVIMGRVMANRVNHTIKAPGESYALLYGATAAGFQV
jgi:hypothetical protein